MNVRHLISKSRLQFAFRSLVAMGAASVCLESFAQTTLQTRLVPAVLINGPLGSVEQVQYSTNLADPNAWTPLSNVRMDTTPKPFYDETAHGETRFYRTRLIELADRNLVWIPPGTFLMGSPINEPGHVSVASLAAGAEGPQTVVTLTKGFFMGRFEVNNSEWLAYMTTAPSGGDTDTNSNPSTYYQRPASLGNLIGSIYSLATNYCALRTAAELKNGLIPPGWYYRLPTEAEWEYACRAGTTTPVAIGNGLELRNDVLRQDAAFNGANPYPTNLVAVEPISFPNLSFRPPVGSYAPNGFGLYDMHGSAQELCWDCLGDNLPGGSVTNLIGEDPVATAKLVGRGGSADLAGTDCRSASRRFNPSVSSQSRTGLRIVLIPTEEP